MDAQQLKTIGRVWRQIDRKRTQSIIEHEQLQKLAHDVERGLTATPPRSALLVGEPGVGKSAVRDVVAARLMGVTWTIFEAGAPELLAGNMFIGQLEERLRLLLDATAGKPVLWLVTEFHELLWAGRHLQNPTGILEVLLPHIEAGALRVLGEVHPEAYQTLLQQLPKLLTALDTHRVAPLGERDTLEVVRAWAAREFGAAPLEPQLLNEAAHLAQQFLPHRATPGRVLHLLTSATERVRRHAANAVPRRADVLDALAQQTGLPRIVLDDREPLDTAELRRFFARRVLGQPEARDAFLRVQAAPDPGDTGNEANAFAHRVADMYRRWAEKRRMKLHTITERDDASAPYDALFAIAGFAAYPLLASESGQHVFEIPGDDRAVRRVRAAVRVAPQPPEPPGRGRGSLLQQADAALAAAEDRRGVVVRRYRDAPAPLVTDRVRGWRTGRLDRVLDGDFDVLR